MPVARGACRHFVWLALAGALVGSCGRTRSRAQAISTSQPSSLAAVTAMPVASPPTRSPAAPSGWTDAAPGVRWRRTNVVDDWRVLEWLVVRLDLARVTPAAVAVPGENLPTLANDAHVLFAIDGGFFDDAHRPDGRLVSRGVEIGAATDHGGTGLLFVRAHTADMLAATDPLPLEPSLDLAVQCGPRLVERDRTVGITRDNGARFARTAACVRDGGRTLDFVLSWLASDPMRGPGLLAFARLLAQPSPVGDAQGCERALNLDGGPSTGVFMRGAASATHAPLGPVPFALVVRDE
jgi:uncharacterized protein YigE (DUF2233 family)